MRTCLVVDDSSVIRKVARRILEGLDFQILEAEDGEKALEACKRGLPDAILVKLYKNSDGYQKRVNARLAELVKEGWFLPEYADDVRKDAKGVRIGVTENRP